MVKIEVIIPKNTETKRMNEIIEKELIGTGYEIIGKDFISNSISWGEVFLKKFPKKNKKVLHGEIFLSTENFRVMTIFSYSKHFTKTIKGMNHLLSGFNFRISITEYY